MRLLVSYFSATDCMQELCCIAAMTSWLWPLTFHGSDRHVTFHECKFLTCCSSQHICSWTACHANSPMCQLTDSKSISLRRQLANWSTCRQWNQLPKSTRWIVNCGCVMTPWCGSWRAERSQAVVCRSGHESLTHQRVNFAVGESTWLLASWQVGELLARWPANAHFHHDHLLTICFSVTLST